MPLFPFFLVYTTCLLFIKIMGVVPVAIFLISTRRVLCCESFICLCLSVSLIWVTTFQALIVSNVQREDDEE